MRTICKATQISEWSKDKKQKSYLHDIDNIRMMRDWIKTSNSMIIFLTSIMITILYFVDLTQEGLASSPSFPIQQVIDNSGDWQLDINGTMQSLYKNTANGPNDCAIKKDQYGTYDFPSPDLNSMSYVSDGKTLNATLWLTSAFVEPVPSKPLNYSRGSVEVGVETLSSTEVTLQDHVNKTINKINSSSFNKDLKSNLGTSVADIPAYQVEYSKSDDKTPNVKVMQIWTKKDNRIYSINYTAELSSYNNYLPSVKNFINSFKFDNFSSNTSPLPNQTANHVLTYKNVKYDIEANYPFDWTMEKKHDRLDNNTIVKFNSPIENLTAINRNYGISIDVQSDYKGAGGDYLILIQWDNRTRVWTQYLLELGYQGSKVTRTLTSTYNFTNFFEKGKSYVTFSLPLNSINSPDKYSFIVAPYDTFLKGDLYCEMGDFTRWYTVPPPRHEATALPNALELRPGEQKDLKLDIRLHSITDALVNFIPYPTTGIVTNLSTMNLTVPAEGAASATLKIKALENATPGLSLLNVGTRLIADGEAYFISTGVPINGTSASPELKEKNATISVRLLSPLTFDEHLNKFYDAWLAPLNAIWGFFVGVATVVAPLIFRKYQTKKKDADK